jgi:maltooligosyltrehalose trehalohydrolase
LYFADHRPELRESIKKGRAEFLSQFPSVRDPEVLDALPDPADEATFRRCQLDPGERRTNVEAYALHRDLLQLRHTDPVIRRAGDVRPEGAVLESGAFVLRFLGGAEGDRLLIINLGCDLDMRPLPEPLLAPPPACHWVCQWSSASVRYGGQGTPPVRAHSHLHVPGECALLLRSSAGAPPDEKESDSTHADADE